MYGIYIVQVKNINIKISYDAKNDLINISSVQLSSKYNIIDNKHHYDDHNQDDITHLLVEQQHLHQYQCYLYQYECQCVLGLDK